MTNYQTRSEARTEQTMRDSMRTYSGSILSGIAAIAALTFSAAAVADMGRTAGSPGVSPSGAAVYSIPIWVQPGPNGMQPSLSFNYNSQSGNGTMGVGWGLSGFGSIERCQWSIAEDGSDRAVRVDGQDRFCLNGEKLRITSGALSSYGSVGAVYQTQVANFDRVTSVGSAGTGPSSFVVHAKNGLIYEYGNTTDSRVVLTGATVYRWLLNKVSDRDGNSYVVTYSTNNSIGRVPLSVQWGPTAAGASTYQYQATFNYVTKTDDRDIVHSMQQGFSVATKQRLSSVEIGYSATGSSYSTKRQYVLTYEASPTTSQSRLTEIKECGATTSNCLMPTAIAYQNGVAGVVTSGITGLASASGTAGAGKVDFNGDGRSDISYFDGSVLRVAFSTGAGFTAGVSTGVASGTQLAVGRFVSSHQDGFIIDVGGTVHYVGYNGSSFTTTSTGTPWMANMVVTDYNGDGLHDFMWYTTVTNVGGTVTSTLYVRRNTTAGAAAVPTFVSTPTTSLTFANLAAGGGIALVSTSVCPYERKCDIDGDGRADLQLVVANPTGCGPSGCTSTHTGYDLLGGTLIANGTPQQVPVYFGLRFNDDQCTDTIRTGTSTLRVAGCGDGAITNVPIPAAPITVMDWDGDDRSDLIVNASGFIGVYRSRGSTTTPFDPLFTSTIPYSSACNYSAADIDGDGLDELACARNTSPFSVTYYTHGGGGSSGSIGGPLVFATQVPDKMASITDGYGNSVTPSYVSTAQSRYTRGTGTALPLVDATDPMIVVGRLTLSDGIGGTFNQDYAYKGARRHATLGVPNIPWYPSTPPTAYKPERDGRWVGFEEITTVDSRNGLTTRTTYEQSFPRSGMVKKSESFQANGTTPIVASTHVNQVETLDSTANNQRYFPYLSSVSTDQYEVGGPQDGQLITSVSKTLVFGDTANGNLTSATTVVTDKDGASTPSLQNHTWTTTETLTYSPVDTSNWCIGLVSEKQIVNSSSAPGVASVTRTTSFTKDSAQPAKCRVSATITEPNSSAYRVTNTYSFDAFGNVSGIAVVGRTPSGGNFVDMAARNSTIDYGTTGQFPTVITDATGAVTHVTYNYDTATMQKGADPNSTVSNPIETSYLYDEFQRRTRATRPDGTYTTWTYSDCASTGCVSSSHKLTIAETDYGSDASVITDRFAYSDSFGRTLVSRSRLLNGATWNGSYQWSETQFDALGRVYRQYMPCTTTSVATTCRTNSVTNNYDLLDRLTLASRPRSHIDSTVQSTVMGYAGRTRTITDALGKTSTVVTNVDGSTRQNKDANNFAINYAYDAAGTVIGVTDSVPTTKLSAVSVHYGIRPFHVAATDSALGSYTRTYNSLGELVGWSDAKGQSFSATYDALSRPLTRTEPGPTSTVWEWGNSAADFNVGQLRRVESTTGGETYVEAYTYDNRTRLRAKAITIPTQGTFSYDLAYDPTKGWLDTLTYPQSTASYRLALKYAYQNGILQKVSDVNVPTTVFWIANASNSWGQVTSESLGSGIVTSKTFDAVTARLASIQSGPSGNPTSIQNLSYLYDLVGNTTQRQNNRLGLTETFYYGSPSDNLYRLEHSELTNGSTSTNLALTYDASGNILTKNQPVLEPLVSQAVIWTPYNYPSEITTGSQVASFAYGPDRQRWRMSFNDGIGAETTYYIGGLLEKVVAGSVSNFRHTILGGNGAPVALYNRPSTGGEQLRYVLTDHQQSAESYVESGTGAVTNASFTAFGLRRDAATWSGEPTNRAALDGISRQGYTYQTALGSMGLNHMNGRVQDAVTGRFLSADPYVTEPNYTQNYNRYSYVYNNPVSFTDPSGFGCVDIRINISVGIMVPSRPGSAEDQRGIAGELQSFGINYNQTVCWDWIGGGEGRREGGDGDRGSGGSGSGTGTSSPESCPANGAATSTASGGTIAIPLGGLGDRAKDAAKVGALARFVNPVIAALSLTGSTPQPNTPIYRSVGPAEALQILGTQQYALTPTTYGEKQFWMDLSSAQHYANRSIALGWEPSATIVTSNVSVATLSMGTPISPSDGPTPMPGVSFPPTALPAVNSDAAKSGGIKVVQVCGGT
jgi:RHS repeat-associated protein